MKTPVQISFQEAVGQLRDTARELAANPVLIHEMRARMRGARAYWILLGYLVVAAASAVVAGVAFMSGSAAGPAGPLMLGVMVLVQAILLALIAPAVTSGAITLEREHQRYDLLASTRLDAATTLTGKLASAIGFLLICLLASLPFAFLTPTFGGVSPGEILASYALLAIEAAILGSIGLFWSTVSRSTVVSTALTYLSVMIACLITLPAAAPALDDYSRQTTGFELLSGICPFSAGLMAGHTVPFFGVDVPPLAAGLVIGPLVAGLIFSLAARNLERFTMARRDYVPLLSTLLLLTLSVASIGGLLGVPGAFEPRGTTIWLTALLLLAVGLPFVVITPDPRRYSGAAGPGGVFALLSATLVLGASLLGFYVMGERGGLPDLTMDRVSAGPVLGVLVPFLLAETGLVMALMRSGVRSVAAAIAGVVAAVGLGIVPPLIGNLERLSPYYPGMVSVSPLCCIASVQGASRNFRWLLGIPGYAEDKWHDPLFKLAEDAWRVTGLWYLAAALFLFGAVFLMDIRRRQSEQ